MKAPKQANVEAQKAQSDLINNVPETIVLSNGKKIKVDYIYTYTHDRLDKVIVEYEYAKKKLISDAPRTVAKGNKLTRQFLAKSIAILLINNYFGLHLRYWLKWRIIYYFWKINGDDYLSILTVVKKNSTQTQYYLAMALLTTMSDMWTMMTKKEAEVFRQELESASRQPS